MSLKASIVIDKDADLLYRCFKPEITGWQRAKIKIKKNKGKLQFIVEAEDAVALRAALSSVTGLLVVYNKTHSLLKKNG